MYKILLLTSFIFLFHGLSIAKQNSECTSALSKLADKSIPVESKREVITIVDQKKLTLIQQKVFTKFLSVVSYLNDEDEFNRYAPVVIKETLYHNKKTEQKQGYKFKIYATKDGADEDVATFYYDRDDNLLLYECEHTTPKKNWVCEGYYSEEEQFLLKVVKGTNDCFEYSGTKWEENVEYLGNNIKKLPEIIRNRVKNEEKERATLITDIFDALRFFKIIKTNKVMGYVALLEHIKCIAYDEEICIEYEIIENHFIFINNDGEIVDEKRCEGVAF